RSGGDTPLPADLALVAPDLRRYEGLCRCHNCKIDAILRGRAVWWLAAVVLVALTLRPAVASVPPLIDVIAGSLGLSATAAGLLTTLPVVCMGGLAPGAAVA